MTAVPDCNYSNNNYICVEEDECTDGKASCGANSAGLCVDLPHDQGQYACQCQQGFQQLVPWNNHSMCVDIRECDNPSTCSQQMQGGLCIEQNGGYLCACRNGYRLTTSGNMQSCVEINECVEQPAICGGGTCSDTPGSYSCSCNGGYQLYNGVCVDINECAQLVYPCGIPTAQAFCYNQIGYSSSAPKGFTCTCPNGYMFVLPDSICAQINNCNSSGQSSCGNDPNAQCVNFQQQYYCACGSGMNFNGSYCVQVNSMPLSYVNGTLALTGPYSFTTI